jgi:hypothetical protein
VDVVINPKKTLLVAEFPQISQEIERAFRVVRQNIVRQNPEAAGQKTKQREAK